MSGGYLFSYSISLKANREDGPAQLAEAHRGSPRSRTEQSRSVLPSHLTETITAIYWFVPSWPEGDSSVDAALRANRWMHLSRSTRAPSVLVSAGTTTRRAAAWFVGETLLREELLFTCRENEG